MIPASECRLTEHRLRVAEADRLGPHLADLDLRRRRRGVAFGRLRRPLGAALVALGARLHGAPRRAPAATDLADSVGAGR